MGLRTKNLRKMATNKRLTMPKYEYVTHDSRGEHTPIDRPSNGYYRSRSERSKTPTKIKKRTVPLKDQLWTVLSMRNFFLKNEIHADRTEWFITFLTPARKMTAADQLELFLQADQHQHVVQVNYHRKHLIIETLQGEV